MKILNYIFKSSLKKNKNYYFDFKKMKGINSNTLKRIYCSNGIPSNLILADLDIDERKKLYNYVVQFLKENKILKIKNAELDYIKVKKDNKTYKGLRHFLSLPVRGQRSKTNAKTQKSKRIKKRIKKKINKKSSKKNKISSFL